MAVSIRNRISPAARALRAALRGGLSAQLAAINADLASEGADYRLPTSVGDESVDRAPQGAIMPAPTPRILIETQPDTVQPLDGQRIATRTLPVTLYLYLSSDDLSFPASVVTQTDEAMLNDAMDDLVEAVRRCVLLARASMWTAAGVTHIDAEAGAQADRKLYDVDDEGQAIALQGRLTVTLKQRTQWVMS